MAAAADPPASSGRPTVSVVVATRDRPDQLAGALQAIRAATAPADEVVVVDSASHGSGTRAVAEGAGAVYRRAPEPGVSLARNLGARVATGELVAFTDDDCRPRPGWADAFAGAFSEPAVGLAVGPVSGGSAADVADRGTTSWSWPADPAHLGSGASMAVRRRALLDVGGFDERLGPGAAVAAGEDHELFARLLHAGWSARFAPGAHVDHDDLRDRWGTIRLFYGYGVGAGAVAGMARSLDPAFARRLLRRRLLADGLQVVVRDLARRWEEPAARAAAMTAGVVAGRVAARHLRSRPAEHRRDEHG